jgi:hypothetical protein
MGDKLPGIEFLEPHEEPDEVAWLDADDDEETGDARSGSHGGVPLPPRTTARRVLGSLLVFALALSTTGFAGLDAFRHDQAVAAAENTLLLRQVDVGDPVTLTDPGQLGGLGTWRLEPSASVAVDVTNQSPDPITLLPGATLFGPGLTTPATLRPSGTALLRPGQSGRLSGMATVDCGVQMVGVATLDQSNSLLVRARTASGAVGAATVTLASGGESVRQQICAEQGDGLVASVFPESVNTRTHSFTVTVSAHSLDSQPLRYEVLELYSNTQLPQHGAHGATPVPDGVLASEGETALSGAAAASELPGVSLSTPVPVGAVSGTLAAGADLKAGYTVRVLSCPRTAPMARADVDLEVLLDDNGIPAIVQADGFDLGTIVGAACGLYS